MPKLYKTTGSITQMDNAPSLKEMQAAVGGDIELVYLPTNMGAFIVNKEGKLKSLPNTRAMRIYTKMWETADTKADDIILGDAILLTAQELKQME